MLFLLSHLKYPDFERPKNQKTGELGPRSGIFKFVFDFAYSTLLRDCRNFGRTTHKVKQAAKPISANAISMLPSPQ